MIHKSLNPINDLKILPGPGRHFRFFNFYVLKMPLQPSTRNHLWIASGLMVLRLIPALSEFRFAPKFGWEISNPHGRRCIQISRTLAANGTNTPIQLDRGICTKQLAVSIRRTPEFHARLLPSSGGSLVRQANSPGSVRLQLPGLGLLVIGRREHRSASCRSGRCPTKSYASFG